MKNMPESMYFCAAIFGDRGNIEIIREMIRFIEKDLKVKVLTRHIAADHPDQELAKSLGKSPVEFGPFEIEPQDMKWLAGASKIIAEVSGISTGVGREIEHGRIKFELGEVGAEVLCIYKNDCKITPMITGMAYPNVQIRPYENVEEAKKIIREFLESPLPNTQHTYELEYSIPIEAELGEAKRVMMETIRTKFEAASDELAIETAHQLVHNKDLKIGSRTYHAEMVSLARVTYIY